MASPNAPSDTPTNTHHVSTTSKAPSADTTATRLTSPQSCKPLPDGVAARRRQSKTKKAATSAHSRQASSTSRGRDFRVGNVGNNGMIYLRPIKRASQAPAANSSSVTAGRQPVKKNSSDPQWRESILSGTDTQHSHGPRDSVASASPPPAPRTPKDSTSPIQHTALSKDPLDASKTSPSRGTFKVVIDRTNNNDPLASPTPLYDVSIPHYRLGTPRFTGKGSAILNSSANTASSAINSPINSTRPSMELKRVWPAPPRQDARRTPERLPGSSDNSSEPPDLTPDRQPEWNAFSPDPLLPNDTHQKASVGNADVRVSRVSGQIVAASIPQLIVHITSPFRLDYDLLSDFFLTFRLFMAPGDLAVQLIQRLRASVGSGDGTSRIVRVRTFVALRHWILNYFVDDFVSDMEMRFQFCEMVNQLCHDVRDVNSQTVGDLRILGELKRCWKHTCALFWDVPMDATADHMEQDIYPGGLLGSRALPQDQIDAINRESSSSRDASPARISSRDEQSPTRLSTRGTASGTNFATNQTSVLQSSATVSRSGKTSKSSSDRNSMQVLSCTNPVTNKLARQPSKGPRPVQPAGPVRAQSNRRQPPADSSRRHHQRSGSFSDALRDDRTPLPAPQEPEMTTMPPTQAPPPGSLIRGALMGPAAPYIESVLPQSSNVPLFEEPQAVHKPSESMSQEKHSHFQPPSVRRFIGSVRKALSMKNYSARPLSSSFDSRSRSCTSLDSNGPFLATPFNEPAVPRRKLASELTVLRVDLLAADIAEAYTTAVRAAVDGPPLASQPALTDLNVLSMDPDLTDPTAINEEFLDLPEAPNKVTSGVTMGSRSIIIADDTNGQITPRPDILNFDTRAFTPETTGHEVPAVLDTSAVVQEVYIDGDGNTIPHDLVHSPGRTGVRASQLSTAHNLDDVTTASLQQQQEPLDDVHRDTVSLADHVLPSHSGSRDLAPPQQIRRMPGGNLRAANHVHSLDYQQLPQTSMEQHFTAGSHPLATQMTNQVPITQPISRQPRPESFESEVAKLADLPDSEAEGGIETALRKLEGRGQTPTPDVGEELMTRLAAHLHRSQDVSATVKHKRSQSKAHRDGGAVEARLGAGISGFETLQNLGQRALHAGSASNPAAGGHSVAMSDASHSSIPLLERGVDSQPPPRKGSDRALEPEVSASHSTEAHSRQRDTSRPSTHTGNSFLLDDNQSLSNLSATSEGEGSPSTGMHSFFDADDGASVDQENGTPSLQLPVERPHNPLGRLSASALPWQSDLDQLQRFGSYTSSKSKMANEPLPPTRPPLLSATPGAMHMCFMLAYDSQLLAQQFTVVERDALCEVEWRDLIDLRWNQAAAPHSNWVDFLRSKSHEANGYEFRAGVDMCIARFNLVVRWAKSEIVMTENLRERAATMIKYIHVAKHCRRMHNWATMYQLTMALVGSDISRLKGTWDLVPPKDRQTLAELEELILPTKNFHNLREEIESATETFSQDGAGGCIPFIGIYTHDLIYNAQKPMYVATEPATSNNNLPSGLPPALVNFERHHTAATIVKNLLRLIEASCKYQFQPLPEVAARCLWISALSDEEVSLRSLQVEPALTTK